MTRASQRVRGRIGGFTTVWLMSASRSSSGKNITFHLPRRSLIIAGIAFGVGLLLFLVVWLSSRNNDFYKASPAQTPQQVAEIEPLDSGDARLLMKDGSTVPCSRRYRSALAQPGTAA